MADEVKMETAAVAVANALNGEANLMGEKKRSPCIRSFGVVRA